MEKMERFLTENWKRQGCLLSALILNIILGIPTLAIKWEKEVICTEIKKLKIKLYSQVKLSIWKYFFENF